MISAEQDRGDHRDPSVLHGRERRPAHGPSIVRAGRFRRLIGRATCRVDGPDRGLASWASRSRSPRATTTRAPTGPVASRPAQARRRPRPPPRPPRPGPGGGATSRSRSRSVATPTSRGTWRACCVSNPSGMFAPIAPTLAGADVAMVNLETAITDRRLTRPEELQLPRAAERVRGAARRRRRRRHHGEQPRASTTDRRDSPRRSRPRQQTPLKVLGIGANATEAYAPWITEVQGPTHRVLRRDRRARRLAHRPRGPRPTRRAGSRRRRMPPWTGSSPGSGRSAPRSTRVVVDLHWGVEGATCPSPRQQELARELIAAGADVDRRQPRAPGDDGRAARRRARRLRPRQLRVLQRVAASRGSPACCGSP